MENKDEMPVIGVKRGGRSTRLMAASVGVLALVGLTVGCGGDDDDAQAKYCEAGESLRGSVDALFSLDLISVGTSGIEEAFDQVVSDADALKQSASDASEDEVDALNDAIDSGETALSDLAGSISTDNASAMIDAIGEISTAATAVYATLSDCP